MNSFVEEIILSGNELYGCYHRYFGNFRHEKHEDEPWSYNFIHFCNRVLRTLPSEENFENESESPIQLLRRRLLYEKGTIQPFLSAHSSQRNSSDGVVPKEKLCELWVKTRKRLLKS